MIYLPVYELVGVGFEETPSRACQWKEVLQESLATSTKDNFICILLAYKSLYAAKISLMSVRDIYPTSSWTSLR